MPVAWCVVTAWHLSSLLLMAIKASALCGALPSTLHNVASAVPVPEVDWDGGGHGLLN